MTATYYITYRKSGYMYTIKVGASNPACAKAIVRSRVGSVEFTSCIRI